MTPWKQYRANSLAVKKLFDAFFELFLESSEAAELVKEMEIDEDGLNENESDATLFQRFWNGYKPYDRSILSILTACEFVNANMYADKMKADDFRSFLLGLRGDWKVIKNGLYDIISMRLIWWYCKW